MWQEERKSSNVCSVVEAAQKRERCPFGSESHSWEDSGDTARSFQSANPVGFDLSRAPAGVTAREVKRQRKTIFGRRTSNEYNEEVREVCVASASKYEGAQTIRVPKTVPKQQDPCHMDPLTLV